MPIRFSALLFTLQGCVLGHYIGIGKDVRLERIPRAERLTQCKAKFTAQTLFACCQILFGMHSGFVRDFTNDWLISGLSGNSSYSLHIAYIYTTYSLHIHCIYLAYTLALLCIYQKTKYPTFSTIMNCELYPRMTTHRILCIYLAYIFP